MKIAIICFTERGLIASSRAQEELEKQGHQCRVSCKKLGQPDSITETLNDWTANRFRDSDAILFVGAAGIAVRSIAPFLLSKVSDPAVLVMDDTCSFVIPLLSGHIGGANAIAAALAQALGAQAVITTATDRIGLFAVDVFAKENGLRITDMEKAKQMSAAILDGRRIPFHSDFPVIGTLPLELITEQELSHKESLGLAVSISYKENSNPNELLLVPRVLTLGIGCKRDTAVEKLRQFVMHTLKMHQLLPSAVEKICSIDMKKEEKALIQLAEEYSVPFVCFSAEELMAVPGDFHRSEFVLSHTGADNVCERSAVLGSGGALVLPRTASDGMTLAAAVRVPEITVMSTARKLSLH